MDSLEQAADDIEKNLTNPGYTSLKEIAGLIREESKRKNTQVETAQMQAKGATQQMEAMKKELARHLNLKEYIQRLQGRIETTKKNFECASQDPLERSLAFIIMTVKVATYENAINDAKFVLVEGQEELCKAITKMNDSFAASVDDQAKARKEAMALVERIRHAG